MKFHRKKPSISFFLFVDRFCRLKYRRDSLKIKKWREFSLFEILHVLQINAFFGVAYFVRPVCFKRILISLWLPLNWFFFLNFGGLKFKLKFEFACGAKSKMLKISDRCAACFWFCLRAAGQLCLFFWKGREKNDNCIFISLCLNDATGVFSTEYLFVAVFIYRLFCAAWMKFRGAVPFDQFGSAVLYVVIF